MNKDLKFYWLDASMFQYLTSKEFTQYLISCKNGVFILEDSETLLKSREDGTNWAMQSLLNISDGMLGDAMNLKFICTFNTDLSSIDSALLRKGRLKVKYEFKPLSKDKVAKIFKEKGIDTNEAKTMPLCDVYNFLEDNGAENKERKKIGFN
jgi:SpoVK/Ycf46/Vps4 family AAA+-type ATPase